MKGSWRSEMSPKKMRPTCGKLKNYGEIRIIRENKLNWVNHGKIKKKIKNISNSPFLIFNEEIR
jgi:hypothetical protein